MLDKIDDLFYDSGKTIQKLAKSVFYTLLVIAFFMLGIGVIRLLIAIDGDFSDMGTILSYTYEDYLYGLSKDWDWYIHGYMGKQMCKNAFILALSSLGTFPMYAFGQLVEYTKSIKKSLENINEKKE